MSVELEPLSIDCYCGCHLTLTVTLTRVTDYNGHTMFTPRTNHEALQAHLDTHNPKD